MLLLLLLPIAVGKQSVRFLYKSYRSGLYLELKQRTYIRIGSNCDSSTRLNDGVVWLPTAATHRPIRRRTRGNAFARPRRTRAPSGAASTEALMACRGRPRASTSAPPPACRAPDRAAPAATCGGPRPSSSSRCARPPSAAACRGHLPSSCSAQRAFQDRRRGKISFPRSDRKSGGERTLNQAALFWRCL